MAAVRPPVCVGCEREDAGCVRSFVGWVCTACAVELKAVQGWQSEVNRAARQAKAERKADLTDTHETHGCEAGN